MNNKRYISNMDELPYYLSLTMISQLTGFSYDSVKHLCRDGELRASKLNREWRVSQDDLRRYMAEHYNRH